VYECFAVTVMERRARLKAVSFTLEAEQVARLVAVATRERRSRSFLVRDALEDALARYERVGTRPGSGR